MNRTDLFAKLDGMPAQILVVLGLALTLLAPLLPHFNNAAVASTKAELDQAGQMIDLDMEKFKKDQDAERKKLSDNLTLSMEDRMKREQELQKAYDAKREQLDRTYDTNQLKRAALVAQSNAAGQRAHYVLGWLGRLMLLLGLLTMTLQSEGLKQKIILIVLLVAMFSSLSGINLDFISVGHMGDYPAELDRLLRAR